MLRDCIEAANCAGKDCGVNADRFSRLVMPFVDGSPTGSERRELEATLRQSSQQRERFWLLAADYAWIDTAVRQKWSLDGDSPDFPRPSSAMSNLDSVSDAGLGDTLPSLPLDESIEHQSPRGSAATSVLGFLWYARI